MNQNNDNILLAIEILLSNNQNIRDFIFNVDMTKLEINPYDCDDDLNWMSSGEWTLANIAIGLFLDVPQVSIHNIIASLDPVRYNNFIMAMDLLRGTQYAK
jgi:hypothetical protein